MCKLSIIVPVYNVSRYLEECVNSLVAQTVKCKEIILVDDGSQDNSGEICDELSNRFPEVKVIHKSNGGLPSARNAGLNIAQGKYIGFIDSDDYICENMYEKLIDVMENKQCDMVICNFATFNTKGIDGVSERYKNESLLYNEDELKFYKCAMDSSCNRIYRADVIKENHLKFEDKSIVAQEDYWFLVRYMTFCKNIETIEDVMYYYRERGSSITKSSYDKEVSERCVNFIQYTKDFLSNNGRNPLVFNKYQILNLLFSSINNLNNVSVRDIMDIVRRFAKCDVYTEAISKDFVKKIYSRSSLKGKYNHFIIMLLRIRCNWVFAYLECMRVKRLYSKSYREKFFD